MKIEYDTTIDEMVTTQMLWLRGTYLFEKWIAWGVFYWALIIFLVFYFGNGPILNKLIVGVLLGAFIGGSIIINHKSMIKKRLRKVLVKKLGSEAPVPAILQLNKDTLTYSANDSSVSLQLNILCNVEETDSGFFLDFSNANVNYIPYSAFHSELEKNNWKKALNEICRNNT